jgi:hypothetical protein
MRIWGMNSSRAALVAAGVLAAGTAFGPGVAANATVYGGGHGHDGKVTMESSGNFGILNGNQVYAPISIPIDVCGNAVAIAGLSRAQCKGGASVSDGGSKHRHASGYRTAGWGQGGGKGHGGKGHGHGVDMQTSGNYGLGNGNQVFAPISVPIDVCGNAVALLGAAQARCKGGASVKRIADRDVKMKSSGNFGALNGNQVFIPISVPVNVCGNAIAALGFAQAECKGGASVGDGHGHGHKELPPTLRTPKKKPYKPSKHRPAAKHNKLPSTMRANGERVASPASPVSTQAASALPVVKKVVDGLRRAVKVPGMDVKPGQVGPMGKDAPVTVGSPVLS